MAPVIAVVTSDKANVRTGPSTEYDALLMATKGQELEVIGSNQDHTWWQVALPEGGVGWMHFVTVDTGAHSQELPVILPAVPDDLTASWAVQWECNAQGCPRENCLGNSHARALQARSRRWVEVLREATWQDGCGEPEDWVTQIDRYGGKQQRQADPPLFYVWEGADPGPETMSLELLGRQLSLWCAGTRTREVEQDDGWTVLFEGNACYDRTAGILVTMEYTKRWLFTGTYGDQAYEREYFGDHEVYRQVLTDTNMVLSGGLEVGS
jgi:hypothetical protein